MTSPSTDRRFGLDSSVAIKAPCRVATTANITLSGEQTVDGIAAVSGDRVLVKNQTSGVNNGIYIVDTGTWSRSPDFDDSRDVVTGTIIPIVLGTTNHDLYFKVSTAGSIIPGTTSLTFASGLIASAGAIAFTPTGTIAATDVQSAIAEVASESAKAGPLSTSGITGASPRATRIDVASVAGTVNLTTAAPDTDDIRITGALAVTGFTIEAGRVIRVTAGGASTLTNNANIVTQKGANIVSVAGDTYILRATAANTVEVLSYTKVTDFVDLTTNQVIAGVKTFSSQPIFPVQSMVRLNTNGAAASGYGSTNTAIRRFTTTVTNQGSDITYADSATLGALFTINTAGVYVITHSDSYASGNLMSGISLNSANLTTSMSSLTASEVLGIGSNNSTNGPVASFWGGYLAAGSLIRPHGNASSNTGTVPSQFTISRVS